ncbi:MAG: sugar isomerase [Planctomycetota bacterium]|nr:MAG: sugar isomerase [Planctomycetota bacterium]
MQLQQDQIEDFNNKLNDQHTSDFNALAENLSKKGINADSIVNKLTELQVATPSWALGTGGTRFGRFPFAGEPSTIDQKLEDTILLKNLTRNTSSISLHIPWDYPKDTLALKQMADENGILFDAINSNTFQDTSDHKNACNNKSYKFGSLCHSDAEVRDQAIKHNIECIRMGEELGSKALTVWLADGTTFPGQANFRRQFQRVVDSVKEIYKEIPEDWKLLVEHKPFEPAFYSSVNNDWGSSLLIANSVGERCLTLVDLGHHLPNTNIEQVVSRMLMQGKLGGFHFNDSKYADDDLTVGCLKPYQLFLIFLELVEFLEGDEINNPPLAWMIDASHNLKDPMEDIIQSLDAISIAHAQALLLNRGELETAQDLNDPALCQELLQDAYRTDVRPLVKESRKRSGGALNPIAAYRELGCRQKLIEERGLQAVVTGL